jgi:hypothetical protein
MFVKLLEYNNSAKGSIGSYELKNYKPWFKGECSKLLDQKKQYKLYWL